MSIAFVFIPDTLDLSGIGFLEGFSEQSDCRAFYVTNEKLTSKTSQIIGYCSEKTPTNSEIVGDAEWIHINNVTKEIKVQSGSQFNNVTCIMYSLNEFRNCDRRTFKSQNYGAYFEVLCDAIHERDLHKECKSFHSLTIVLYFLESILKVFSKLRLVLKYSSTMTHFEGTFASIKWILTSIKSEGEMSLKVRNAVAAKVCDLFLGFVVLLVILKYEQQIFVYINRSVETIIQSLKELLEILMGSPIGLKLNHAFNTTLGIFFFYHISLWKVFVQFTRPLLYSALYFLLVPGVLGLSFQAAIFQDLIRFCTIHVYCIYVYAARLYGLQVHALISLWRLFIGRKYNPLRQRVDSYQYSHHQLFIGTLGFTILLFLLPTTLLYYVVFTVFRLSLISLNFILTYLRVYLQCLPIYVIVLWLFSSASIAGAITLKVMIRDEGTPFRLCAKLKVLPLWTSVKSAYPDVMSPLPGVIWSRLFHNLFTGALL